MSPVFPAHAAARPHGAHLVLYDGVCGLCDRLLQFVLRHDHRAVFRFAPLQSATGRAMIARWGGDPQDLTSFYVVADFQTEKEHAVTRSDAVLFVVRELGWPWKMVLSVGALPRPLRNRMYDAIARSRYRIFGRYEQCLIPTEEWRSRFVE